MTTGFKVVARDAAIVYGLTFTTGLVMAIAGMNLQNEPSIAYLTNLLSGAIGFTVAGIRIPNNRTEHLAWVAATVWTFNLTNVALGIQTSSAWIQSGLTILFMFALGGSLSMILTLTSSANRQT